jgi:branched-chain amino acid transport system ATP-binding protein
MTALLTVENIHTYYDAVHVLFGVDLEVNKGEVVVLLGRNGAGKTTTLKTIMGILPCRSGTVRVRGDKINGLSSDAVCRAGLGYVPEDCRIFRGLTVRENLEVARRPPGEASHYVWSNEKIFDLFPVLRDVLSVSAESLSGGQQRMLAIARTLVGNPDLVLLDEPSEGLAPIIVQQMVAQLQRLKSTGLTILLSEQNLALSLALADRAYVIEKGEIRYKGPIEMLRTNAELRQRYLMI